MSHSRHNGGRCAAAPFCLLLLVGLVGPLAADAPVGLALAAWHDADSRPPSGIADLLAGFHERNPGVRVNINHEDWAQARVRLKYWFGSHRQYAPDLTVLPDTWLAAYADRLLPLDDVLKPRDTAGFVPAVLDRCRAKGHLVGLPWLVRSRALYYRADLLEAATLKPPRTLPEIKTVAAALAKPPDVYGLGLPAGASGGALETFLDLLAACGGQPYGEDGKLRLEGKEAEAALGAWVELQRQGALEPEGLTWTEEDLMGAFVQGHLAMLIAGPDLSQRLRQTAPTLKCGMVALPAAADPALPISVDVLVALDGTPQPDAVARFLRFMATPEAQRAQTFMGGLPAIQSHYERVRGDDDVAPFVTGLERARGLPLTESEAAQRIVERALWLALSGRATPAEALKTATDEEAQRVF